MNVCNFNLLLNDGYDELLISYFLSKIRLSALLLYCYIYVIRIPYKN